MKVNILDGKQRLRDSRKEQKDYFKDIKSSPASSGPASLPVRLGGAIASGLDIPANFLDAVNNLVSSAVGAENNSPNPLKFREGYKYLTGTTEEQLQPQGFLESIGQRAIEKAPLAAAYGGLPAVGIGAAGAAAGAGLQQLGAPDWLSTLGELGVDIGGAALRGKIPTIGKEQKASYEAAEKAADRTIKTPKATKIQDSFKKLNHALGRETNKKVRDVVKDAKETLGSLIRGDKIDPKDVLDIRKSINKDIYGIDRSIPQAAKPYLKTLQSGIKDYFTEYAIENPEFYEHLSKADKLTELKHMKSYIADWVADKIPTRALSKVIPAIKGGIQDLLGATIGFPEKIVRRLFEPEGRDLYFNMAKAAFDNSPALFLKSAKDFGDFISGGQAIHVPASSTKNNKKKLKVNVVSAEDYE